MSTVEGRADSGRTEGFAALAAGDWATAAARLEEAVEADPGPEVLEALGQVYFWLDHVRTIEVRERAYRAYRDAGDPRGAARVAVALALDHSTFNGDDAVAQGWLELAGRQLRDLPDTVEHGLLAAWLADYAIASGDLAEAEGHATRAVEIGREVGDAGIEMIGRSQLGLVLVCRGEVAAGMRLLDASAAAAVSGEIGDRALAGYACCYLINACDLVHDVDRAAQWCRQLDALCERVGYATLQNVCRAEYAGVLVELGEWPRAEREMMRAAEFLASRRPPMAVEALVRLAELRRREGRLDEAAGLFEEAWGHPRATLGRAAVDLDRGHAAEAAAGAERYLRCYRPEDRVARADGLDVLVRARVALGELAAAESALVELDAAAERVGPGALLATARLARAELLLARGDPAGARRAAEDAVDLYERVGAPYGTARGRTALASVHRACGDHAAAQQETDAAARVFARLGAAPSSRPRVVLTAREVEVIRLVSDGLTNTEVARRLVLSEHTVHRHLANAMTKLGVRNRAAAVSRASSLGLL